MPRSAALDAFVRRVADADARAGVPSASPLYKPPIVIATVKYTPSIQGVPNPYHSR